MGADGAIGVLTLSTLSVAEGVAPTMFAHPFGLALSANLGVRGGECSSGDVSIGVAVFLWDGDAHSPKDARWVKVFWADS